MPRERLQEHSNTSEENLIISNSGSAEQIDNTFTNPLGPDIMPSSPPPSYQRVLEETRLATMNEPLISTTRSSMESLRQDSSSERRSSGCDNSASSTNIILDDLTARLQEKEDDEIAFIDGGDVDIISHNELSMTFDYQEASTSFDASSRQLDNDSLIALAPIQDDENEPLQRHVQPSQNDSETKKKRPLSTKQRRQIIEVANKKSKEMYAALAAELGLTCQMSDNCRCLDCQSAYLYCGDPEGDQGDGGLGAGTPMFVSEVFGHGSTPACAIL